MKSRHLLNLSVQNVLDCISENFNLKNFPRGAFARNSLEKRFVRSPDGCYCAHITTVYYCWFARDVTAAMLVVKNKSISLLWELNSFFMYILRGNILLF